MNFENAFRFLEKLKRNNNREWFEKNKEAFLSIKADFESFVSDLYNSISESEPSLAGLDPKKMVFRIYRDVRFSKDKRPYKTYLSAGISERGKGTGFPGYYLQIEPGNKSFVCVGLYAPLPEDLAKVRQEIDYNGDELTGIITSKKFKKHYEGFWDEEKLKTAPKGYPKDHPMIEELKLKHYVIMRSLTDAEVMDKRFTKKLQEIIETGGPFRNFLIRAIET